MDLTFEWDEEKAQRNESQHGVTFEEAKTVFNDPFTLTISDPVHSDEEDRWLDIGLSAKGRLLVVWHTERGDNIRITGCRRATKTEMRTYAHDRT